MNKTESSVLRLLCKLMLRLLAVGTANTHLTEYEADVLQNFYSTGGAE